MTLTEYLSSAQAIDDVRALLAEPIRSGYRTHVTDEINVHVLCDEPVGPWRRIDIDTIVRCYYREPTPGAFVVSDCGEAVSGIMRRTGRNYKRASNALCDAIGGALVMFDGSLSEHTGDLCPDLATALVRVLSAVAKCAEVK